MQSLDDKVDHNGEVRDASVVKSCITETRVYMTVVGEGGDYIGQTLVGARDGVNGLRRCR